MDRGIAILIVCCAAREPESANLRELPTELAFFLGAALVAGTFSLLTYSIRHGRLFGVVAVFGFFPFLVGFFLILSCILASPPPVFGVVVKDSPVDTR